MSSHQETESLQHMILSFRVSELQTLLGFAGRNKHGRKQDLVIRALDLLKLRSSHMQAKIRELYKASQAQQAASLASMMSGPQSGGSSSAGGHHSLYPMGYGNIAAAAAMMGLTYPGNLGLTSANGRNPYPTSASSAGYPHSHQQQANPTSQQQQGSTAQQQQIYGGYPGAGVQQAALPPQLRVPPAASSHHPSPVSAPPVPLQPDVKLVKLPFYDVIAELLRPSSLITQGNNRHQDAQFQFYMSPSQATDIASHRDIRISTKLDYLYQIQLRFCPLSLDSSKEMADEFPPGIMLQVNGKGVVLPNPIPTNRTGVEPKRPPKPVNITSYCKLSPILPNIVSVKWAGEYGKGWVVGIWLVMKCTSEDLLERLKKKGNRNSEYTKKTIIAKMCDDDDVETECLRVSVACPLGKMRMTLPCRPSTCGHLQCFDASLFLQMNERKPTWNCPVCDSKALFDDLMIDGYFMDVINSKELPKEENDIILNRDGSWMPVPREEETSKTTNSSSSRENKKTEESPMSNGNGKKSSDAGAGDVDLINLSDDENSGAATNGDSGGSSSSSHNIPLPPPPLLPQPPLPTSDPVPPPPPPPEIECIDLE